MATKVIAQAQMFFKATIMAHFVDLICFSYAIKTQKYACKEHPSSNSTKAMIESLLPSMVEGGLVASQNVVITYDKPRSRLLMGLT